MIRYLRHAEIDREKWDECIGMAVNQNVSAYSWYLDTVSPGWDALVEDEYRCVFPLTWKKKYSIKYLFQPFFTSYWKVYSKENGSSDTVSRFLDSIPPAFRYIDICIEGEFRNGQYRKSIRKAQKLDMSRGYEAIKRGFSDNARRNLKKAETGKLQLEENIPPSRLVDMFKKENAHKVKEFGQKEYEMMGNILEKCRLKGCCIMLGASREGSLCSSAAYIFGKREIIYFKGASDETGRSTGGMYLIMNEMIQRYAGTHLIFDFGGSNVPGVARFNYHFGAQDYMYSLVRKNSLPHPIRWIKK